MRIVNHERRYENKCFRGLDESNFAGAAVRRSDLPAKAARQPTCLSRMYQIHCGSEPARDGGLTADLSLVGVHIHSCGNGHLGFRPYGGSLGKAPSNQGLLPLSFGPSPRLRVPSLRSCSVGPPPSAIHGRGRLTRHPCRVAHCAEPPLGLSRGRAPQKQKRGGLPAGLFV